MVVFQAGFFTDENLKVFSEGCHQSFSKKCLLADSSYKIMTSRSPFITTKFLNNKSALDQMLAGEKKKRRYTVANMSYYVYVNTSSEIKTYLNKARSWLPGYISPKFQVQISLFSQISQGTRSWLCKTDLGLWNLEIFPTWYPFPNQLELNPFQHEVFIVVINPFS